MATIADTFGTWAAAGDTEWFKVTGPVLALIEFVSGTGTVTLKARYSGSTEVFTVGTALTGDGQIDGAFPEGCSGIEVQLALTGVSAPDINFILIGKALRSVLPQ